MWIEQLGGINEIVFYVFCAVSGAIVILSFANIIVGCCVKGFSGASSIDFHIAFGAVMLAYTVLARGLDEVQMNVKLEDLDILCQFFPAALLVGLTMFIGGLMVKSWGMLLYNKYNRDKKPISEEWKPNLWIWFLLIIIAGVSVAWCIVFTPHLKPKLSMDNSPNSTIKLYECVNDDGRDFEWKVSTSVWHGFLLLLAVIAIIPNCSVVKSAEANILSVVTLNTLFAVVAGICLHFLYEADATETYAIQGGLMLWICLFADIMFLASKILGNRRSKGMSEHGDNYDTINSDKRQRGTGAQNDGYLEPQGGDTFQY